MKKFILFVALVGVVLAPVSFVEAKHCDWPGKPACSEWVKTIVNTPYLTNDDTIDPEVVEREKLRNEIGILQMKMKLMLRTMYNNSLR